MLLILKMQLSMSRALSTDMFKELLNRWFFSSKRCFFSSKSLRLLIGSKGEVEFVRLQSPYAPKESPKISRTMPENHPESDTHPPDCVAPHHIGANERYETHHAISCKK